jgi:DNA-binding LacI/PurR family transcriptional regulator
MPRPRRLSRAPVEPAAPGPAAPGPAARRLPATAHDVARQAGVSQSAVSRSFTPGASVSEATRSAVLAAAGELGYQPNLLARSLITRRSRIIGMAVGYLHNQFYPAVLQAMSERLQALGYHLLLFTAPQAEHADPLLEDILRYQVDGLVLASTSLSSRLAAACAARGVPVVLFNRVSEGAGSVESVTGENRAGGRAIARFLVAGGHRRFAFIAGIENSSTSRDRERGFREGLAAHGIHGFARAVGGYDMDSASAAADALLGTPDRPDAVFCASDHMAIAVLDRVRGKHRLRVPEDVSVVGFDDAVPAAWPAYGLTTFHQPVGAMVEATVRLLVSRIEGRVGPAQRVVVQGDLLVRGSARLPADGVIMIEGRRVWRPVAAVGGRRR